MIQALVGYLFVVNAFANVIFSSAFFEENAELLS